jgi:hypothetical protein
MLDLQARVHLKKVELARGIRDEKFNRARAHVIDRPCHSDSGRAHPFAQRRIVNGRRAFFDYFLMAALN